MVRLFRKCGIKAMTDICLHICNTKIFRSSIACVIIGTPLDKMVSSWVSIHLTSDFTAFFVSTVNEIFSYQMGIVVCPPSFHPVDAS